ncbi:hypothetical protein P691DRAFT_761428 [Macrolepiota fuliginosa MF-IS2]|uniref:Uncharacterized protein n=1 Tax=Macrolepiota fuliginosa MF-IS2 TaxID=1400762 RepID=A0A9P6C2G7_9AGAR|nr:hypothetical protein P691DRAFT_761428 [Macrolepiota fuliginosa MF-IS2]
MGNSGSTLEMCKRDIDEGTLEKIKNSTGDIEQSGSPGEAVADEIAEQLEYTAEKQFSEHCHYKYTDPPPGAISGKSKVVHSLCSISTPVGDQTTEYLKKDIFRHELSRAGVPSWFENRLTGELTYTLTKLVLDSEDPEPEVTPIRLDEDGGDDGNWRVDVVIVSVSGAFVNDGLRAGVSLIHYIGVFYQTAVDARLKQIRDTIRGDAYKAAPCGVGETTPTTDAQLFTRLERDSLNSFQKICGFPYNSNPPGSWRAEGVSSAYLKSSERLTYFSVAPMGWDYLNASIQQTVFTDLQVPIASVEQAAIRDLALDVWQPLSHGFEYDSWQVEHVDHTYYPTDPTLNPIYQKGVLMWWDKTKLVDGPALIGVLYVFFQVMLYEVVPVEQRAMRQLFQLLCDKIRKELHKPPVKPDDLLTLKDILQEYARMKFQSTFGFAYSGDKSSPPARQPGGAVRGICQVLQTADYPASVQKVENWLNSEVLQRDSLTFPKFANNKIWEKIRDDIVAFTKTRSDDWSTSSNTAIYQHPDGKMNIKQYSLYVYAVGEVTLEGVKVVRTFVCYLGVYCGTLETS